MHVVAIAFFRTTASLWHRWQARGHTRYGAWREGILSRGDGVVGQGGFGRFEGKIFRAVVTDLANYGGYRGDDRSRPPRWRLRCARAVGRATPQARSPLHRWSSNLLRPP